jgi:hypothetical protein
MKLPEYVPKAEVQRVCAELGISDWTKKKKAEVSPDEAKKIFARMPKKGMDIALDDFCAGLAVELEHGIMFKQYNVTNNHPLLTGMIVMAHFMESLDYYKLLDVAELEGDLVKAIAQGDMTKTTAKYRKLTRARIALSEAEARRIGA